MCASGWKDPSRYISKIYVEEGCLELDYTREILLNSGLSWSVVADRDRPNDLDEEYVENLAKGKKQLFLCENRGQFFKPCPGTREYQCCDYQVLHTGSNCPIDCVYCILQAYLNAPWITAFVNLAKMFAELDEGLSQNPEKFYRIGTGEFADSLALDRLTNLSKKLVPYFADKANAVLELKTKSAVIDNLQGLSHNGRTVVAWSLNSSDIVQKQELRAASLKQRLQAARRCTEWGYKVAFHFDPIIEYPGWEKAYEATVQLLFSSVPAEKIAWISLGALRYLPSLKEIAIRRFPFSRIYYNEFILGLDGKQRYFRPHRVAMYKEIYNCLKERASSQTCIYFCMESNEIWREVMGFSPDERGGLGKMLDEAVRN
ncbi:MAG: DNA photolyase [Deltaproteobacteria bacterium]|nr:MAG: DNA photolyase [Deltaproteobacteria bacterium]